MKTTLYNHKLLDSDIKPIIPNAVFKDTCEKLRAGDQQAYEKVKNTYTLVPLQSRILDQLQKELC